MRKTICLDFDGVMNDYTKWDGEENLFKPRPGIADFLTKLRAAGFDVVVCSSRDSGRIRAWLKQHGLDGYVTGVVDKKPPAIVYLDDRGLKFEGNYDMAFYQIVNFQTYWEAERGTV